MDPFATARSDASALGARLGTARHDIALVLGTGWAPAAERVGEVVAEAPMSGSGLAGFPPPSVPGHAGVVRSVEAEGRRVLVFVGRAHLYEGHPTAGVVHAVRTAVLAGCRTVVLTNAAGGVDPGLGVGQAVLISDHINLTGQNPLVGAAPAMGRRFVDLTDLYSLRLRTLAREVDPSLPEAVYAAFLGPSFETPAEVRMAGALGAGLVGMSTALEAIAAHQLGAEVLGISLVTNPAAGIVPEAIDHEAVLSVGQDAAARGLGDLLGGIVRRLATAG